MPGWQDLIVCGTSSSVHSAVNANHACGFNDLILLIKAAFTDLTILATLLTVIVCIFIGFRLMTAGDNAGARTDAKKRALQVLIGYVCILGAWVVVYTITSALVSKDVPTFLSNT